MPAQKNPFTPSQFFKDEAGRFVIDLDLRVDGVRRRVHRVLEASTYREALTVAIAEVDKVRTGRLDEYVATSKRSSAATIGEILKAYISSDSFEMADTHRKRNANSLRMIIRTALGKPAMKAAAVDKLSAKILTGRLVADYKAEAKATWLPAVRSFDQRDRPPVAGKLKGRDLSLVRNRINKYLVFGRSVFTADRLHEQTGAFCDLTLPSLDGFLAAPGVKANKQATGYIPPDDRMISKILAELPDLKSGEYDLTYCIDSHTRRVKGPSVYCAIIIAMSTGTRGAELASLTESSLRQIGGRYYLTIGATEEYDGTKAGRDRNVLIPPDVVDEVREVREQLRAEWEAECDRIRLDHPERVERARKQSKPAPKLRLPADPSAGDFLVPGSPYFRKRLMQREVAVVMRQAGWTRPQCLHELRKIWASDLGSDGVDVLTIMEAGGWRDWSTAQRYTAKNKLPEYDTGRRLGNLRAGRGGRRAAA